MIFQVPAQTGRVKSPTSGLQTSCLSNKMSHRNCFSSENFSWAGHLTWRQEQWRKYVICKVLIGSSTYPTVVALVLSFGGACFHAQLRHGICVIALGITSRCSRYLWCQGKTKLFVSFRGAKVVTTTASKEKPYSVSQQCQRLSFKISHNRKANAY